MHFLTIEITSKKVHGNDVNFSTINIKSKIVCGNDVYFSTSEITPKKVRGNEMNFSTVEITSKKVRGTEVDFSINKTESLNQKVHGNDVRFFQIWPLTSRRNIDVESRWYREGVPISWY